MCTLVACAVLLTLLLSLLRSLLLTLLQVEEGRVCTLVACAVLLHHLGSSKVTSKVSSIAGVYSRRASVRFSCTI